MKTPIFGIAGFALFSFVTEVQASPLQDFEMAMCKAIFVKSTYPGSVLADLLGSTTIQFKYSGDKASDIKILKSGGNRTMDETLENAVAKAQMPPRPNWLPRGPLQVEAALTYPLGQDPCSISRVRILISDSSKAAPVK